MFLTRIEDEAGNVTGYDRYNLCTQQAVGPSGSTDRLRVVE